MSTKFIQNSVASINKNNAGEMLRRMGEHCLNRPMRTILRIRNTHSTIWLNGHACRSHHGYVLPAV